MALSNIFREPRRELTESLAGSLVLVGFIVAVWPLGRFLASTQGAPPFAICLFLAMLIGILAIAMFSLVFLVIPHWIGEEVCDFIARRGLELRPKQRYR